MTKTSSAENTDSEPEIIEENMNNQNGSKKHYIDYAEWMLLKLFEALKNPSHSIKRLATYIMENGGYKFFDSAAQWLILHPFSGLILSLAFLLSLPFLLIIGLGILVAIITFAGFIFIEGTLLTFISVLSFGCFGALAIVLTAIVVLIVAVYMGFAYIYDMYLYRKIFMHGNGEGTALSKFLCKENLTCTNVKNNENKTSNIDHHQQQVFHAAERSNKNH